MSLKNWRKLSIGCLIGVFAIVTLFGCKHSIPEKTKPRVIVSSDIGGTDPDDFQSMIHLMMYSDIFQIEGIIASPYGEGRKENIWDIINLYEKDYDKLLKHSGDFPPPDSLRKICKQGATSGASFKGFTNPTEGSEWIIKCAKKERDQPLWILVWGGIDDLAQALHDAPEIKENIRVYFIGGPNKKWSVNTYAYIAANHPDLYMIEANATYRGWFMDEDSPENLKGDVYYENFIKGQGALGKDFKNYYDGNIKMGDTPSLAYLMNGDFNDPGGESWGGSFVRITRSSRYIFDRNTTLADTVACYSTMEWKFEGPDLNIPPDSACFTLIINKQQWPGYYLGNGTYGVYYSPKKPQTASYVLSSDIAGIDGQSGQFVCVNPWPGKVSLDDYKVGPNWYSDRPDPELFIGEQQGAKTVSKYREEFLMDWAQRWEWLK